MIIKFNLQYILFFILFFILPLTDALAQYNATFSYLDEIYLIIMVSTVILGLRNNRIKLLKLEIQMIILFLIIFFIGMISSIVNKIQPLSVSILELITFPKFVFSYFAARIIFSNFNLKKYKRKCINSINVLTVTMFILFIVDSILNIFGTIGYRFGFKAYNLIFTHPTYLAGFSIVMISIYTFFSYEKIKYKKIYIFINLLLITVTLRNKAMIFVLIYLFITTLYKYIKTMALKIYFALLGIVPLLLLFQNAIMERIFNEDTVRNMLYRKSLNIGLNYFPLGAGLGTFASYISGKYYSPLYYEYGLSNTYGMTPTNYSYVADTFWPMVLAQFGIIGFIIFIVAIFKIIQIILKVENKYNKISCILIMIYILISSTSEAIFNTYIGVILSALIGIFISLDIYEQKIKNNSTIK